MPLWVSFALLAVGAGSIFLEIFVPAGGLIGIAGLICIAAAVILGYVAYGIGTGTLVLLAAIVLVPLSLALGLKIFPGTWIGKRLILGHRIDGTVGSEDTGGGTPDIAIGGTGVALTDLRPAGTARIGNRKYSVVTSGEYLDRDSLLQIVQVEGNRIVVRTLVSPADMDKKSDKNEKKE